VKDECASPARQKVGTSAPSNVYLYILYGPLPFSIFFLAMLAAGFSPYEARNNENLRKKYEQDAPLRDL
jgi:hypothetical protein